jgi:hypothetical protein
MPVVDANVTEDDDPTNLATNKKGDGSDFPPAMCDNLSINTVRLLTSPVHSPKKINPGRVRRNRRCCLGRMSFREIIFSIETDD